MNFIVSIVFEHVNEREGEKNLWEERFFIVTADFPEDAERQTWEIAQKLVGSCQTESGKISTHPRFVIGSYALDEDRCNLAMANHRGSTELFSRFLRESEAKSLAMKFRSEDL